MRNIIRLSVVLTIVTAIAAWVLAEIYSVTKPQIEIQKLAKTHNALDYVMPEAKLMVPITRQVPVTDNKGDTLYQRQVTQYYKAYADTDTTQLIGYAFKAEGTGYSSLIETMVGIDTTGHISTIKIISQKETPGLGALSEDNQPFNGKRWSTRQFDGKTVNDLKVDKDGGEIVSITGATITSRSITNSIRNRMEKLLPEIGISAPKNSKES
jgi:electron transport complex protein RnfG